MSCPADMKRKKHNPTPFLVRTWFVILYWAEVHLCHFQVQLYAALEVIVDQPIAMDCEVHEESGTLIIAKWL